MNQPLYFTVGPSQILPIVPEIFAQAFANGIGSINHRSKQIERIYEQTLVSLKKLMQIPDDFEIYFTGSGSEIWERIGQNLVKAHSYHIVNGAFSKKFCTYLHKMGKQAIAHIIADGSSLENMPTIPEQTELISIAMNETSTGAYTSMETIKMLSEQHPQALIAVDAVSVAPFGNIDFKYVDTAFFSVQKNFGMPAGLGVWIVGPRAIAKGLQLNKTQPAVHNSITSFHNNYLVHQTPSTPNVLAIYVLGQVCNWFIEMGIKNLSLQAQSFLQAINEVIGGSHQLTQFVQNKKHRSPTIAVLQTLDNNTEILQQLQALGFIVSNGYSEYKHTHVRIGAFPAQVMHASAFLDALQKALR